MPDALPVRSVHLHSLESLLSDLVSGRPIGLGADGERSFTLESVEARALLEWYRRNSRAWNKEKPVVETASLKDIVTASAATPPVLPETAAAGRAVRTFVPKRVVIHRFAGIQEYDAAEDLVLDFDRPLILLEGHNGSGKTSILSAVAWCLTGKVYRAQRPPADGDETVELTVAASRDGDAGVDDAEADDAAIASTLVCPVPPKAELDKLSGNPLPLDTWVEMTFVETGSGREYTLRRWLHRAKNKKPKVEEKGFPELGLDPVAFDIGTVMPGMLPHIRIGSESDLGKAIAKLTGLAPLRSLVKHAQRAGERIESDLVKEEYGRTIEADKRFVTNRDELAELVKEHPAVTVSDLTALDPASTEAETQLRTLAVGIERQQADAYAAARAVLGDAFDPGDAKARGQLDGDVGAALAALDGTAIGSLPSAATLAGLGKLSDEQLAECEAMLKAFRAEGQDLLTLAADPTLQGRMRLYARVANWLREEKHADVPPTCPVCLQPFDGRVDPATGAPPHQHLSEALSGGRSFLEKTLSAWAASAYGDLVAGLPEALRTLMDKDLPAGPVDLLRAAMTTELFAAPCFAGVLAPLLPRAEALCMEHLATLPPYTESPVDSTLAGEARFSKLDKTMRRLERAIAFARWRRAAAAECVAAFRTIIGVRAEASEPAPAPRQPLVRQVEALQAVVRNAAPLASALKHISAMQAEVRARRNAEAEIARARKAAGHLSELFGIHDLVVEQLNALRVRLDGEAKTWFAKLYRPATEGTAPTPDRSSVDPAGKWDVSVQRNGTLVSAESIGNASFLRAYLTAFLFAFWKHILSTRGGFSLLVLDDPQEALDPNNRHRLAETLGALIDDKASLLTATYDTRFAIELCAEGRQRKDTLKHLSVHGRSVGRPCVQLAPSLEEIEKKRRAFEREQDAHQAARDYGSEFRKFLEARLLDLLDRPAFVQPSKLTISEYLEELRRLIGTADGLTGRVFEALRDDEALKQNSPFLRLLNKLSHGEAETVVCSDVREHSSSFKRVQGLVLDAHDEHRRWLKRQAVARLSAAVDTLPPMNQPSFAALRKELDLAAFAIGEGGSGGEGSGDPLPATWFADKALFMLAADTLGFSAPMGSVLIVECASSEVDDHRLVVARHRDRVYVRRLVRSSDFAGRVALVAENEDPQTRLPPVVLPADEVYLHKVVGVLFTAKPPAPRSGNEAYPLPFHPRLRELFVAYQARGSSAIPLVLDGQTVLGGASIAPASIDSLRSRIVAVTMDDGSCVLKRVGEPLSGLPNLRLFESVGGLGNSLVIQMEDLDQADGRLPRFVAGREVVGVLYGG